MMVGRFCECGRGGKGEVSREVPLFIPADGKREDGEDSELPRAQELLASPLLLLWGIIANHSLGGSGWKNRDLSVEGLKTRLRRFDVVSELGVKILLLGCLLKGSKPCVEWGLSGIPSVMYLLF